MEFVVNAVVESGYNVKSVNFAARQSVAEAKCLAGWVSCSVRVDQKSAVSAILCYTCLFTARMSVL